MYPFLKGRTGNEREQTDRGKCAFLPDEIYYDNSATTRTREESAKLVYEMLTDCYGNPSSLHRRGFLAQQRLDKAREQTAATLGCQSGEIYFTSGGTEADNIAILGAARAQQRMGKKIVTTAIEHDAVLNTVKFLEGEGWEIVRLKPDREGKITAQQVLDAVDNQTALVSMMAVNNEVGSVLPVAQVSRLLRKEYPRVLLHCDAVQAWCKQPLRLGKALDVDFLSVSGHKIYAPKGCGALYVKKGSRLRPVSFGGGQEKNIRPGTEGIANLCAMGLSAQLLTAESAENHSRVTLIRDALLEGLTKLPDICINSPADATPYILNFSALGVRSEIMLHFLEEKGIYVSSGSACAKGGASHVLQAMGLERERADSAIRLSFGRYNTPEQVPLFLEALEEGLKRFRR
ncbi:MAG: cysteine desulfurase [Clostridium sp.]|jgi:cysteine desulfurase|nr:cysteine desulfurase [Clostridium sp.]